MAFAGGEKFMKIYTTLYYIAYVCSCLYIWAFLLCLSRENLTKAFCLDAIVFL